MTLTFQAWSSQLIGSVRKTNTMPKGFAVLIVPRGFPSFNLPGKVNPFSTKQGDHHLQAIERFGQVLLKRNEFESKLYYVNIASIISIYLHFSVLIPSVALGAKNAFWFLWGSRKMQNAPDLRKSLSPDETGHFTLYWVEMPWFRMYSCQ